MSRLDVAEFVRNLVLVYTILIITRIILSYFTRIPYNRALSAVIGFVNQVTDPYLNLFRRLIPPVRAGGVGLDLSPVVALIVLQLVGSILVGLIAG